MPRRIEEDHKHFRDVVEGRARKAIRKYMSKGTIFRQRAKGGKIGIPIDRIAITRFKYGDNKIGVGRGPGKPGDVIGRDPQSGKGNKAGDQHGEGIELQIDLEYVLKFLQEELCLPNLKPKENQTFEETEYKYNDISQTGPHSLRHMKRTLMKAYQRLVQVGDADKLHEIPGMAEKVRLITPINSDFRYRQYKVIKKPSSNAVIFFARDCSYSMNDFKCDIVSDMSWWIDVWIRSFYKKTERCYFVHDTEAQEVDEEKFYKYRYGGGTKCSSALNLVAKQLKYRFPPEKWNVYLFYFSDGENWENDNDKFCQIIKDKFPSNIANFVGITQVLPWNYEGSLKQFVNDKIDKGYLNKANVRTTGVGFEEKQKGYILGSGSPSLSEDERNKGIQKAIKDLLGKQGQEGI